MKVLYYDCFAGISGDMNLGALVDLGVEESYLVEMLNKLSIKNEFEIKVSRKLKMGISGTKIDVILKDDHHHGHDHGHTHGHHHEHTDDHQHDHHHESEHDHKHSHHSHEHDHESDHVHQHDQGHSHEHRNLESIQKIINESTLKDNIKKLSLKIFMEVAKAEAKVHGKSIEEVHFHEVGAVDSIVDIVGAAICLDYLSVDKVMASTVELGGGFVNCAHGTIPIPAPATVEILKDVPVSTGRVMVETTTPTGAAILKANVNEYADTTSLNILKTGYGLGTRDLNIPNVLRVYLAEDSSTSKLDLEIQKQMMVEANIDDMNPELYDSIEGRLFEHGALDVYKTNIMMKKGRPAVKLSVLVPYKDLELIETIILTETTTLGIREYPVEKKMLKREFEQIDTKFGKIDVKKGILNGQVIKVKPEYDVCKDLAKKHNVPIKDIYAEINKLI